MVNEVLWGRQRQLVIAKLRCRKWSLPPARNCWIQELFPNFQTSRYPSCRQHAHQPTSWRPSRKRNYSEPVRRLETRKLSAPIACPTSPSKLLLDPDLRFSFRRTPPTSRRESFHVLGGLVGNWIIHELDWKKTNFQHLAKTCIWTTQYLSKFCT